jgi:tetratricopeptide (TPR) repeat protein
MPNRFLLACILVSVVFGASLGARENSSLLYEQGRQYARQGNFAEAGKIFERVVELSPRYALGHYGLGRIFLATGRDLASAVKHLRIATELDGSMPQAHFYLGMACLLSENMSMPFTPSAMPIPATAATWSLFIISVLYMTRWETGPKQGFITTGITMRRKGAGTGYSEGLPQRW